MSVATRSLVLGSGGLTGIAWETGVIAGLAQAGVSMRSWELVVGSSAGAAVGARLLIDGSTEPLLEELLAVDTIELGRQLGRITGRLPMALVRTSGMRGFGWLAHAGAALVGLRATRLGRGRDNYADVSAVRAAATRRPGADLEAGLRALGRIAMTTDRPEANWVAFWSRLLRPGRRPFPARLIVTAIDVASGERCTIDASMGISVSAAVAASTALPGLMPPVTIAGRRRMDGGLRSPTNADLAAGCGEVCIVAPLDRGDLAGEQAALIANGARVGVIQPSAPAVRAMGAELARLDPRRIAASARHGIEDGRAAATWFG
jgi:NTE family protein